MSIVEIPARDLARVLPFRAEDDLRYYLNGVYVEPYSDGCLLVATNGHWIAVMDSKGARADLARILSVSKPFDKAIREAVSSHSEAKVTVDTETSRAVLSAEYERYVEPGTTPFLDGKFPEWRKVIPPVEHLKPGLIAPLQTKYISYLQRSTTPDDHYPGVRFWHDSRDPEKTAVVARFNKCPEFIVAIMPVRDFGSMEWPTWMVPAQGAAAANS